MTARPPAIPPDPGALPAILRRPPFSRFYPGWWIAVAASLVSFTGVAFFNPVLGALVPALQDEFGWSVASIAAAMTIGTITAALISPLAGPLADRYGSRWMLAGSVALMTALLAALAFTAELWQFWLFYGLGRAVGVGIVDMAVIVTIANWFVRGRGRAMGMTMIGTRGGMSLMPLLLAWTLGLGGLQAAFIGLAVLVGVLGLLPPLIVRRRPEDAGLHVDGAPPAVTPGVVEAGTDADPVWTVRQALRTRSFWLLLCGTSILMVVGGSLNFTFVSHLAASGIDRSTAVFALSLWAAMGIIGGVLGGELRQRLAVRYALSAVICFTAGSLALFVLTDSVWMAMLFAVWHGLSFGAQLPLTRIVFPDYFGRYSVGGIRGATAPVQFALNAFGPLIAGFVFDWRGSYDLLYAVFIGLLLLAALSVLAAPKPQRPRGRAAATRC